MFCSPASFSLAFLCFPLFSVLPLASRQSSLFPHVFHFLISSNLSLSRSSLFPLCYVGDIPSSSFLLSLFLILIYLMFSYLLSAYISSRPPPSPASPYLPPPPSSFTWSSFHASPLTLLPWFLIPGSVVVWTSPTGRQGLNRITLTSTTRRSCSMCPPSCPTQKATPSRYLHFFF